MMGSRTGSHGSVLGSKTGSHGSILGSKAGTQGSVLGSKTGTQGSVMASKTGTQASLMSGMASKTGSQVLPRPVKFPESRVMLYAEVNCYAFTTSRRYVFGFQNCFLLFSFLGF